MKIGIISDLHTEFWYNEEMQSIGGKVANNLREADIILLAGDIGIGAKGAKAARKLFPDQPVCIIAGNHEFYHSSVDVVLDKMMKENRGNVHVLHRSAYVTEDFGFPLRVLGVTLWTDYQLFGDAPLSMFNASRFPDFCGRIMIDGRTFEAGDALLWHQLDKAWLFAELDKPFDGATIVMTHHAPVSFSVSPQYEGDMWNPCFSSRLDESLIRDDLDLVVWGHTHYSVDKTLEKTRFVSNQLGYPMRRTMAGTVMETGDYGVVVEVARINVGV